MLHVATVVKPYTFRQWVAFFFFVTYSICISWPSHVMVYRLKSTFITRDINIITTNGFAAVGHCSCCYFTYCIMYTCVYRYQYRPPYPPWLTGGRLWVTTRRGTVARARVRVPSRTQSVPSACGVANGLRSRRGRSFYSRE